MLKFIVINFRDEFAHNQPLFISPFRSVRAGVDSEQIYRLFSKFKQKYEMNLSNYMQLQLVFANSSVATLAKNDGDMI